MTAGAVPDVLVAGGTGALGRALSASLAAAGHRVRVLTRRPRHDVPHEQLVWDGRTVDDRWARHVPGSVLVNLAGELVDRPPTDANVRLLTDSGVDPTRALVSACRSHGAAAVWLQMSTLAIYGDAGDRLLSDLPTAPPPADGPRQMAGVARAWEEAAADAEADRVVVLRAGVVLAPKTPALDRLATLTRWYLGGRVGSGRQYVSWLHVEDFLSAVHHLLGTTAGDAVAAGRAGATGAVGTAGTVAAGSDEAGSDEAARGPLSGVVHLTSPSPVRNADLMAALRRTLHRPWTPPTPAPAVRLGARLLFRTDPALALTGRRAVPDRLLADGFRFTHPDLDEALDDLLRPRG